MEICENDHVPIVYNNSLGCPLCDKMDKSYMYEKEIEDLKGDVNNLEIELETSEGERKVLIYDNEKLEEKIEDLGIKLLNLNVQTD